MTDLDKGGGGFQQTRVWLGPSLGWTMEQIDPSRKITIGGTYSVIPGDSLLLIDTTGAVTINLPDVKPWIQQPANQPATAFDRSITVKDLGGNAGTNNIIIKAFGTQTIDEDQQQVKIISGKGFVRLVPLIDLSGWIIESGSGFLQAFGGPFFGVGPDRVTMLHPAYFGSAPVNVPATNPYGVFLGQTANFVNQWIPGGSPSSPGDFVNFGSTTTAPDGTVTAQKIVEGNTNQTHSLVAGFIPFEDMRHSVSSYRLSVFAKAAERTRIVLAITDTEFSRQDSTAFPGVSGCKAVFDLNAGAVAVPNTAFNNPQFIAMSASIDSFGEGWYRCSIDIKTGFWNPRLTTIGSIVAYPLLAYFYLDAGSGNGAENSSYAGNGSSGIYTWRSSCLPISMYDLDYQAFFDDFDSITTIDINNTKAPGFNWYVDTTNQFLFGNAVFRNGVDFDVANSVLNAHLQPPLNNGNQPWMAPVVSNGTKSGWLGQAWAAPLYLESRMSYDHITWPDFATFFPRQDPLPHWSQTVETLFDLNTTYPPNLDWPLINGASVGSETVLPTGVPLVDFNAPPSFNFSAWKQHIPVDPTFPRDFRGTTPTYPSTVSGVSFDFAQMHIYGTYIKDQATGNPPSGTSRNILPNSSFAGAVPGSPGTLPTNMSLTGFGGGALPPGLLTDVVSVVGGKYQFRFHGTPSSGNGIVILGFNSPLSSAGGTMTPGQIWTGSVSIRLAAGTDVGFSPTFGLQEADAASVIFFASDSGITKSMPFNVPTLVRYSLTIRPGRATFAKLSMQLIWNLQIGTAIDATWELYQPQLELSAMPTPFQASFGGDPAGVLGISLPGAEPFYRRVLTFFDGGHCGNVTVSSYTDLGDNLDLSQPPHNFELATYGTGHHYPIFATISQIEYQSHFDWMRVITTGPGATATHS